MRAGDKVGVQLRNQLEFPLTWFAVAEIGAAVVPPLNPKYTARECAFVLEDSGASWLVVASDIVQTYVDDGQLTAPVERERIVVVGDRSSIAPGFEDLRAFGELASAEVTPPGGLPPDQDTVVNIQFTSGTTGLPKGCLLTHRYWIELGVWGSGLYHSERILADHPFYYMQNQGYLMNALAGGGAIYVTAGMSRRKFMDWLVDHEIDMAWIDEGAPRRAGERQGPAAEAEAGPPRGSRATGGTGEARGAIRASGERLLCQHRGRMRHCRAVGPGRPCCQGLNGPVLPDQGVQDRRREPRRGAARSFGRAVHSRRGG